MLNNYFFPAVKRHKEYQGNPNAYKIYIRPIEKCLGHYCEKFEVETPLQVIDMWGLWGDAVDNIPGIPGIGEKTAKALIQKYGSMES